ncbi:D-aminoacyl-tRNA deacylase [Haloglycomyces albus]|uniref:D-aminoacyl-tRNA deacylase n=1 Tax=Haloglycomyces albus TaxID=526067 RepID=UPI00046CA260|nr:D-aminoacyl-tRNA deacylase [Haloglycomyces albus]
MKAVVQTVSQARVTVDDAVVGAIDEGLLVLLGVTHTDSRAEVEWMANKIWNLRIMDDEQSASDRDAPILCVSQFTLYADARKGRRPSWKEAAPSEVAEPIVNQVVEQLRTLGARVETGKFGAMMDVSSVNVGPRTIILER